MPSVSQQMKEAIQSIVTDMMDQIMNQVLVKDPFSGENLCIMNPLYSALIPDEIFKSAYFEQCCVTPFLNAWTTLVAMAAQFNLGFGATDYCVSGTVKSQRLRRIAQVVNTLAYSGKGKERQKPDWDTELAYVLEGGGEDIPVQIVCDVYAVNTTSGEKYAFELKAPLPNSDQSKVSKEKLLKLYSMDPSQITDAYYALPYNPYASREAYNWSFPARWFNMRTDKVVLIGDEFWEKIGGMGTYQAFIAAVNEIGPEYKERIYREYLGIAPPDGFEQIRL